MSEYRPFYGTVIQESLYDTQRPVSPNSDAIFPLLSIRFVLCRLRNETSPLDIDVLASDGLAAAYGIIALVALVRVLPASEVISLQF